MSVEKFRPLGEEEAHEEANMMRARLRVSAESGKIEGPDLREDREPTPKDYEDALQAVENMKRMAEEDPDSLKTWKKVSDAIDRLIFLPGRGVAYLARVSHALMGPEPGGPKERWKRNAEITEAMAEMGGIEQELRVLKAKAEKFGMEEAQKEAG